MQVGAGEMALGINATILGELTYFNSKSGVVLETGPITD